MVHDSRLGFAKGAANLFTTFYDVDYLGIVSFANSSSVNYPLTLITNDTQRNAAKAAVNSLAAAGATNIGGGLQTALAQLTGAGDCLTWSFSGGAGVSGNQSALTSGNANAPEGNQVAFLQGANSQISQTIGFQPETTYKIIFSAAQRSNCCGAGGQDFELYLDRDLIATFKPTTTSYGDYSTTLFTLAEGPHTLKFVSLNSLGGDNTAFIDNVRITAVRPTPVFFDDFNSDSIAPGPDEEVGTLLESPKWTKVEPNAPAVVTEELQQLRISLPPSTATYNGVASIETFDMRGRFVEVEVSQPISQAGWCENFIKVELDEQNYYLIDIGAGTLVFRSRVNGVNDQTSIPYDPAAFPNWRIKHNSTANTVSFETSNDGNSWTVRKQVAAGFSLEAVRFYLFAGAWGNGNAKPGVGAL